MTADRGRIWSSAAFGLLYISLYHLSALVSEPQKAGGLASIFFLPAFVRLLGFLIVEFWIIPALFLASIFLILTGAYDLGPGNGLEIVITAFTSVGGPFGVFIASRIGDLKPSLVNLTPLRLLVLSIGCAGGNVAAHYLSFMVIGFDPPTGHVMVTIFLGDLIGTWVIIYLIKIALTVYGRSIRS